MVLATLRDSQDNHCKTLLVQTTVHYNHCIDYSETTFLVLATLQDKALNLATLQDNLCIGYTETTLFVLATLQDNLCIGYTETTDPGAGYTVTGDATRDW